MRYGITVFSSIPGLDPRTGERLGRPSSGGWQTFGPTYDDQAIADSEFHAADRAKNEKTALDLPWIHVAAGMVAHVRPNRVPARSR